MSDCMWTIPSVMFTWLWCVSLWTDCWIRLLSFHWGFCIDVDSGYGPVILFPCVVLVWILFRDKAVLTEGVWKCSVLSRFWNSLRRIGMNSWIVKNWPVKVGSQSFLYGVVFDCWFSLPFVVIYFNFFSWFSLGRLYVGMYLFILGCHVC